MLTVAVHDFRPTGCTVRLRVWGIGASASQYHHVDIVSDGSDGFTALDIPRGDPGHLPSAYVHVQRDPAHAADTCGGVNITGMHMTFGTS